MKITRSKLLSIIKEEIQSIVNESKEEVKWDDVREQIRQGILFNMTILDFLKSYHGPGSKTQVVDINGQLVQAAPIDWQKAIEQSGIEGDDTVGEVVKNHPSLENLLDIEAVVDDTLMARKQAHAQAGSKKSLAKTDSN